MEKNKINVIVSGTTASGKTTIAEIINKALLDNGIEVELNDDFDALELSEEHTLNRIKAVASKTQVQIDTLQLNTTYLSKERILAAYGPDIYMI